MLRAFQQYVARCLQTSKLSWFLISSFGHNLCFRCSNKQCDPILNIYVPRAFQWYKERYKSFSFDPWNRSLKFWDSIGTPFPKVGVALGVWGFIPSHFSTLPKVCDVTPMLSLGPRPCNPLVLVASPKLGLRHWSLSQVSMVSCFLSMKFSNKIWHFNLVIPNNFFFNKKTIRNKKGKRKSRKPYNPLKTPKTFKSKIELKKISILVSVLKWIRP